MTAAAATALVAAALAACALATVRVLAGPARADRIVALDIYLASAVALAVAAALLSGRTAFLDVAIVLSLVSFVGTVGWARLVERAPREPRR